MLAVPRVARDAVQRAVGEHLVAELRRRCLGEQDGIGGAPLGDGLGVDRRHVVLHRDGGEGGAQALGENEILGRDRHGGQRTDGPTGLAPRVERVGGGACAVRIERRDRVERLGLAGAFEQALDDVARGNLARGEGFHVVCDGAAGEILSGHDRSFRLRRRA
jgi:hypothetical protein